MAAMTRMEQPQPTFLSREALDDIRFYQDWLREVLLRSDRENEYNQVRRLLEQLETHASDLGLEDDVAELRLTWAHKQLQRTVETVEDLREHVFESNLFRVAVVVEGEAYPIEGIALDDRDSIVPVIAGGIYGSTIDDVLFDR